MSGSAQFDPLAIMRAASLGKLGASASSAPPSQFQSVPPRNLSPSDATNLSPADYAKFKQQEAGGAPSAAPAISATVTARAPKPSQSGAVASGFDPMAVMSAASKGQLKYTPPTAPDESTIGGVINNVAAGGNSAIASTLGAPVDLATAGLNAASRGVKDVTGLDLGQIQNPIGGSQSIKNLFGLGGFNPDQVPANGEAERAARAVGGAVTSLPLMGMGGAALEGIAAPGSAAAAVGGGLRAMPIGAAAAPTAVGAATGQVASDAVPEPYKPYADLAGNVLGGGVAGATQEAALGAARGFGGVAGRLGMAPRQDYGGIRATGAQAQSAVNQLAHAAGGSQQLGEALAARPEAPPGYQDTLAQGGGNLGLRSLEQAHRTANAEPFLALEARQNAAQVGAVKGLGDQGNPAAVGAWFTKMLDALDQAGTADTNAARQGVAGQTEALGGHAPVEAEGEKLRTRLSQAKGIAKSPISRLYDAVDPDKTLTMRADSVRDAAGKIAKEANPAFGLGLEEVVAHMAKIAAHMPRVARFADMRDYRKALTGAIAKARASGDMNAARQLGDLKTAVDADMERLVSERVASDEEAVASGELQPEDTLLAQLGDAANDSDQLAARRAAGEGDSGEAAPEPAGNRGLRRTEGEVNVEPGHAPGSQGVSPEVSAGAVNRLREANRQYKDYAETYKQGAVGRVLKPGSGGYGEAVPDSKVLQQFFSGGPTEGEDVAQLAKALGGPDKLTDSATEYLAHDLRTRGIIQPDGTLNPKSFPPWLRRHERGIDAIPGLRDRFNSLETAQRTFDETAAAHDAEVKRFQKSVAGKFLGNPDPVKAVAAALNDDNPTVAFRKLVALTKPSTDATAGLKRAVADYFAGATVREGSEDVPLLRSMRFRELLGKLRGPLKEVFGGQGVNSMDMVAAAERRRNMPAQAIKGSHTTANTATLKKHGLFGDVTHGAGGNVMLAYLADKATEAVGGSGLHGLAAGAAAIVIRAMHQRGIKTTQSLISEALVNPEFARELVQRVPPSGPSIPLARRIARTLIPAVTAGQVSKPN